MIISMVFQSIKSFPSLFNSDTEASLPFILALDENIRLSAGDVGYSDWNSSGSAPKILFQYSICNTSPFHLSLPTATIEPIDRKHRYICCVCHILLCPCPQEEWSGNQGLYMHHEVSLNTVLTTASLWAACLEEVLKEREGLGSRWKQASS